jgi:hypothetical protein
VRERERESSKIDERRDAITQEKGSFYPEVSLKFLTSSGINPDQGILKGEVSLYL